MGFNNCLFFVELSLKTTVFVLQWQFLARDEGEKNPEGDSGWIQDEGKHDLCTITLS